MTNYLERIECHACGRTVDPGGLFYISRTEIISGFDGVINEPVEEADAVIAAAIRAMDAKPAQELMDDVYQEFRFILCPSCRLKLRDMLRAFARQPKGGSGGRQ